jgi:general stress protein 26
MSRRDQIRMSDEEANTFLEEERTIVCATNGRDGWPHLMPLWYVPRDDGIWCWTYAKSQKTRNLERDPRATLQVETGTSYEALRGVMLTCDTVLHRDPAVIEGVAMDLVDRYSGAGPEFDPLRDFFRGQVPKRVGLQFMEHSRVTWDHRKLGTTY